MSITRIIILPLLLLLLVGCNPAGEVILASTVDVQVPAPSQLPSTTPSPRPTRVPTATPTIEIVAVPPSASPTTELTATDSSAGIDYPSDWSGPWDVYISNPKISIVNQIEFQLPGPSGTAVRAEWIEGVRTVYLEGILSEDGQVITGTFWNTDIEALDTILQLSPDGSYFTGIADSEFGSGMFCGARPGQPRPNPCRGP